MTPTYALSDRESRHLAREKGWATLVVEDNPEGTIVELEWKLGSMVTIQTFVREILPNGKPESQAILVCHLAG